MTTEGASRRAPGMAQVAGEQFSLAEAVGGWRGLAESTAPGLVFVVVYVAVSSLGAALASSLGVALLAVVGRLLQRTALTQALGGVLGVAVGVLWAWRSGQAEDYFAWGLWVNAGYLLATLLSLVLRWPAVGVVVALLRGTWDTWRSSPGYHRFVVATWLWLAMFALRLAVQVPLYLDANVAWLGTARLVMGAPLFAVVGWFSWLLVREPRRGAPGVPEPR